MQGTLYAVKNAPMNLLCCVNITSSICHFASVLVQTVRKRGLPFSYGILFSCITSSLGAQTSVNPAGGNLEGSGGNVSYTIGQTDYLSLDGPAGTISEGVQQVYTEDCLTSVAILGDSAFCASQGLRLSASAGTFFLWSTGASTRQIVVNATGTYAVSVTDSQGCTATASRQVVACDCAIPVIAAIAQPACGSDGTGSATLTNLPSGSWTIEQTGTQSNSYAGMGNTFTVTGLPPGVYRFQVRSSCGAVSGQTPPFGVIIVRC